LKQRNPTKKSLRWADLETLGSLEEKYSPVPINTDMYADVLSPYKRTPAKCRPINMNLLTGSLNNNSSNPNSGEKSNKRIRRSLSMNDINNIIITQDDTEENQTKDNLANQSDIDPNVSKKPFSLFLFLPQLHFKYFYIILF